jgi:formylglycine-generating enzyme
MNAKCVAITASICLTAAVGLAENPVIDSFHCTGRLTCGGLAPGSTACVEWASSPDGPWTNSWEALAAVATQSNGAIAVSVPMCYRVRGVPWPEGMALIPAGSFEMGDDADPAEGEPDELPRHTVFVSGFYMDKYEVTNDKIVDVFQWAFDHSAPLITVNASAVLNAEGTPRTLLDLAGSACRITWDGSQFHMKPAKGSGYPCVEVSWYGAAAYCNYRSLKEGRTPCYDLMTWTNCNWNANGYRLPTEAEREKAARGGLAGQRFPWGATINHSNANYCANGSSYPYDSSPYTNLTYHPDYGGGELPYTSPVGSFPPNGYGLYDMSGNAWEWCWDWYADNYYSTSPDTDPRGPETGTDRVERGGCFAGDAFGCRVADRGGGHGPGRTDYVGGFRTVLPGGP